MRKSKRPIGRPRALQPRTINVCLRLTEAEAEAVQAQAVAADKSRAATVLRLIQQMLFLDKEVARLAGEGQVQDGPK